MTSKGWIEEDIHILSRHYRVQDDSTSVVLYEEKANEHGSRLVNRLVAMNRRQKAPLQFKPILDGTN